MAEDKGLTRSQREEKVLQFWKENKIFDKTLEKPSPKGEFVFYEGPPTANGKPGIHHLESRAFKDAIPRYKTMRGFRVPRKAGWDTHGLPVEIESEKKLGLKSKREIEEYGIARFNEECKKSVLSYIDLWSKFTERIGYFVNLDDAYFTYNNSYIESVWNVIGHANEKNLLYKDYKIVPWCPRCGTGLSSHELAQGYQDVKDLSLYVKFKIVGFPNAYFVAWTTTPWTLPGNLALAVGGDITYVEAKIGEEILVLAKDRLSVLTEEYEIVAEHKGKDMSGMEYEPLYPFIKNENPEGLEKAFKVYVADFVTTEDGTGIVHTAVMYGQEDFDLGKKVGLPKIHLVSPDATFVKGTDWLEGRSVVDETLAVEILKDLQRRGLLYKKENYSHSYPFCWRCKTRLIYYARDSWYIRMSSLRDKLVKENEKINWEPDYIKHGRFGEWLREVKDWAISRERYWGTPLPIWISSDGNSQLTISNLKELQKYAKKSGNKYFVMRHAGTTGNKNEVVSFGEEKDDHVTEEGLKQALVTGEKLKSKGIDLVFTSPFARTRETAELVRQGLNLTSDSVIVDDRLHEVNPGEFDGKKWSEYHGYMYNSGQGWFERGVPNGESFQDVSRRIGEFLYEIESKYKDKNILIVTHGGPAWICHVVAGLYEPENNPYHKPNTHAFIEQFERYQNAEVRELPFVPLPHDSNFRVDLHRPYIDDFVLENDGKEYRRTKEVMDVWLDSGSMPFAAFKDEEGKHYPADFISEGIDQTRGWFYTLHAVGMLMDKGHAYKNVICLGLILDKEGKKMSKSVGNIVEPFEAIDKYGADVLRLWMYSVNQPGEPKNFDERSVDEVNKRIFNLLDNVYAFYELYRDKSIESDKKPSSKNILDRWILEKLRVLEGEMTESIESYKLLEPVRATRDFIEDLSTWYLRRSRDRLKQGDKEAKKTLYFVLRTLSKLLAPFAPFASEELYQKLRLKSDAESVHLSNWPEEKKKFLSFGSKSHDQDILNGMMFTRSFTSMALMQRSTKNIKIRQPLQKLVIKHEGPEPKYWDELKKIIMDEVNVKEVSFIKNSKPDEPGVELDTKITPELEEEGRVREIIRSIQDMRKEKGLHPNEKMEYQIPEDEKDFYNKHSKTIESLTNTTLVNQL